MPKLNDYLKARQKSARRADLVLTRNQEKAILDAYIRAGDNLVAKIKKETDPLRKKIYADYAYEIHETSLDIIKKYSLENAVSHLDQERLLVLEMLSEKGAVKAEFGFELKKLVNLKSTQAVEQIIAGEIYKDGLGLSERIWKASAMAANNIQEVVAGAMAENLSAIEMAKLLEDYVNPEARKTWTKEKIAEKLGKKTAQKWKDVEYNALRLARTTITHSFTQSIKESGKINPFFKKAQWHSVHAAGRTCDICKAMDGNIYTLDELPFDHPNGLCYITHYFDQSLDQMADRLADWINNPESDSELEEWWASRYGGTESTDVIVKN